jgi:hypothetical protein
MGVDFWVSVVKRKIGGFYIQRKPWKHRPSEALNARLLLHPLVGGGAADASWAVSITCTITTPNSPSAATIAIIAS